MRAAAIAVALVACSAPRRVGSPCGGEPAFAPFDEPAIAASPAPTDGLLDRFVAWYQAHGRARDLGGCRFAPTCSAYAREALHHYGPVMGIVMIVDRLIVREHAFASDYYPLTCIDHVTRLDDAIP